jgi:PEP-CTERM motif
MVRAACATSFFAMRASLATATPIVTVPSGLASGSTYFLAFVTADQTTATSANISDYDTFVTNEADMNAALAALGTTWQAIGSTATVNAADHADLGTTVPVYLLSGQELAANGPDLFNDVLFAAPDINQFGDTELTYVWTGTHPGGPTDFAAPLGGPTYTTIGESGDPTNYNYLSAYVLLSQQTASVYGISRPLVVPQAAAPEPGSIMLLGTGLMAGVRR